MNAILKQKKLFGTDGIRGEANAFPVRPDMVLKVGQAMGYLLRKNNKSEKPPMVLIGKDTRLSGYMLEQALASGLNSMGVWVQLTGPLPTPGIGFLAQNMRASAGVVISASHNPYQDNGIKIFDEKGFKISQKKEQEITDLVFSSTLDKRIASPDKVGRSRRIDDAAGRYIVHVKNTFPLSQTLDGVRVVLDCAHGACYKVAPTVFEELGADLMVMGNKPNGYNINKQSGALFPEKLKKAVLQSKADVGISLDGDGDRVIMVDEKGDLVNGDHILGICALDMQKKGLLIGDKVVTTFISNKGLETWLNQHRIRLERTETGDRNVVESMQKKRVVLGGEPSGHIIFLNQSATGDGLVASLNVLAVMGAENKKLSTLRAGLKPWPQEYLSLPIKKKIELDSLRGYSSFLEQIKADLQGQGRVYVRYSGTEPILRIMVEGKSKTLVQAQARKIADFLCAHGACLPVHETLNPPNLKK